MALESSKLSFGVAATKELCDSDAIIMSSQCTNGKVPAVITHKKIDINKKVSAVPQSFRVD